jgi:hypothetical protein
LPLHWGSQPSFALFSSLEKTKEGNKTLLWCSGKEEEEAEGSLKSLPLLLWKNPTSTKLKLKERESTTASARPGRRRFFLQVK